jgi:hypothetical protein
MPNRIDFPRARRLRRSVKKSLALDASIENVQRALDQATQLGIEAKANMMNAIAVLEESATKLRRIISMPNQPTSVSIAFNNQLTEVEELLRIARKRTTEL